MQNILSLNTVKLSSMLFALFLIQGCASMFKGTDKDVLIQSSDDEAKLYVNDQLIGRGQAHYALKKNKDYFIWAEGESCKSNTIVPTKSFDPTTLLGIFIDYGIISILLIDGAITGSWQDYDQSQFHLELDC